MVKMMIDWQANAMCINHHQPSKPSNSELYQPDPARILRCIETYSYCYCMSMRTPHSLQVRSTCSADPDGCASAPEKRNESQWDQWAMFHIFHIRSQFLSLAHESGGFVYRRAYGVAGCEKLHPAACQSFKSVDTSRSFIPHPTSSHHFADASQGGGRGSSTSSVGLETPHLWWISSTARADAMVSGEEPWRGHSATVQHSADLTGT